MHMVVLLILVHAILGAQAQNIGQCLDSMLKNVTAGSDPCTAMTGYIECLLQKLNLAMTEVSERDNAALENIVNGNIATSGLNCTVDVRAILKKIRHAQKNTVTQETTTAIGYGGAQTLGDCTNALTRLSIQAGGLRCRLVIPYLKCSLRVTGFCRRQHAEEGYLSMESELRALFKQLGLDCEFDIRELCAEVAREQTGRVKQTSSVNNLQ